MTKKNLISTVNLALKFINHKRFFAATSYNSFKYSNVPRTPRYAQLESFECKWINSPKHEFHAKKQYGERRGTLNVSYEKDNEVTTIPVIQVSSEADGEDKLKDEKGIVNIAYEEENDIKDGNIETVIVSKEADENKSIDEPQQQKERDQWSSPIEFILSCIAMSVGLGNVWRFPATAMKNGGGAFLIPYLTVLLLIGRPLYYMELCMGQFTSFGCVKVWNMVPAMRGIGYAQVISTWAVVTYYVSLMGITLYYFFASFSYELPWTKCPENSTNCLDLQKNGSRENIATSMSPSETYYVDVVTKTYSKGLDDGLFAPDLYLTLCLLLSWILLFVIISRGVKSSGKAAYFMALFPYFVLFGLLGRGLTLPGSMKGIKYFFTPDFSKILELNVWKAAVGQCFFSLSVGFGSITMLASFNDFKHNVYRDAWIISVTDTLTSILAGATTFSIMGYLSEEMGLDNVADVLKGGGTTLAFVSYPDVITHLGWYPQIFACFFFFMLFTLGMGSATALTGCVITVVCDNLPNLSRFKVTIGICALGFLLGLFYVTPQGQYILELVDSYLGEDCIYILAIVEVVSVQWIYGFRNFIRDIEFMLGMRMGIYWKFCWLFFVPVALACILFYSFIKRGPMAKGGYIFGPVANGIAISLAVVGLSMIPLYILITYVKHRSKYSSMWETLRAIFLPSAKWGPQDPVEKNKYLALIRESDNKNLDDGLPSYRKTQEPIPTISHKINSHSD